MVPFPVGGGTDIVARMVADKMREALKANVVVDNKPGASAQIGTDVTDAAPDGYTLLIGTSSLINGPALFPNLPYDAARQLRPVASLADLPIFCRSARKRAAPKRCASSSTRRRKLPASTTAPRDRAPRCT